VEATIFFFDVRHETFYVMQINFCLLRLLHGSGGLLSASYSGVLVSVHSQSMSFAVVRVAMAEGFLRIVFFYPFSIIPPMLHTHLLLHVSLKRRTKDQILGAVKMFRKLWNIRQKRCFTIFESSKT
jgi:hypothetical protein